MSLQFVLTHILNVVKTDPDRYLRDIFGDARCEPHAATYGDDFLREIKHWIMTTEIPVVLGWNLDPAQIPGVTLVMERSTMSQSFMGDAGFPTERSIPDQDRTIVVPAFSPALVEPFLDQGFIRFTLPDSMPPDQQVLVTAGFHIRDKNGLEYEIGRDGDKPTAVAFKGNLAEADLSSMEIITPFDTAIYRGGAMLFDESVLIAIHGHADRQETVWLWAIIQWGLLRFRPLLIQTFAFDLALPSASDLSKDDSFLGENIWRRFITLQAKAVWTWEGAKQADVAALLLGIKAIPTSNVEDPNLPITDLNV